MRRMVCIVIVALSGIFVGRAATGPGPAFDLAAIERPRILAAAETYLKEKPVTITAFRSPRSAGGPHDFSSEGDYWWPDPRNPDGPYIQRDGMTNPDNFVEHRRTMIRFSIQVGTLTSAYVLARDERYAAHAMAHLRAWFVDEATRMNPHLKYAQAVKGRATGRGTGIIDTIHLVEVAQATRILAHTRAARPADIDGVTRWFAEYLAWLTTHEYGIAERDAKNNHGTCWVMQVAAFARLTGDGALLEFCRRRYKEVLVPDQMAPDGSFPLELKRTKPYGYSLFNLDALAAICQILSTPSNNLWEWALPDGRGIRRGMAFLYPFILDKSKWPFAKDVMYFDEWPVRHPSLLFAGLSLHESRYLDLWTMLNAWFRDAKFGLFIHWALYAIPAGEWKGKSSPGLGEWIMNRAKIPVAEYEKLAARFNPVKFDAGAWVQIARSLPDPMATVVVVEIQGASVTRQGPSRGRRIPGHAVAIESR